MAPSIRTFLLINLLLSITLIASLAIVGNIFLEHKDLRDHLDAQLSLIALTIQIFSSDGLEQIDIAPIQKQLDIIPKVIREIHNEEKHPLFTPSHQLMQFQVLDGNNHMILKTADAPNKPLNRGEMGFSDQWIGGKPWRVFASYSPQTRLTVVVAERYDFREEVENHITKDSIFIMLITYPFLGLLIWIIVGRGLDSLKKVTREIRQRAPTFLEPVDTVHAPTEIKPLLIALNRLLTRLREAFEREKRFAADAAHELKTPLAALKAQAQVALKAKTSEERDDNLKKLVTGVDRSTHVVEQLLTMTRMVSEEIAPKLEPVNLVEQAKEVIALMVPTALKKDTEISLTTSLPQIIIQGIPAAISILMRNLIDNAIRYTPKGSDVQVIIEKNDNYAKLRVIDNGPGVPSHLRERIFERFYRMLGTKTQGSGLGLSIVNQVAKLHDATVQLKTPDTGKGLEIIVTFPVNPSS